MIISLFLLFWEALAQEDSPEANFVMATSIAQEILPLLANLDACSA